MKRNKFLLALLGVVASPFAGFSRWREGRAGKGIKIPKGEGRLHGHIRLKGVNSNVLDVKVSGSDTEGGLAVFEQTSLSQGRGTPLHVHPFQDEMFYVIEGAYYFQVGDERFHLETGDSILLPKNVPHAWTQVSPAGKMTVIFQPAGKMEEFFVAVASLEHEPAKEEMAELFTRHEMKIVGPVLKAE